MLRFIEAAVLALSGLIVSFALSWLVLASVNFLYPVWLDYGGINDAIEEYAPQNKLKPGFEHTSRDERIEAFAGINKAIHFGGEGLSDLRFVTPEMTEQPLLTAAEVQHLQDVANLIDVGKVASVLAVIVWLILCSYFALSLRRFPSIKLQFVSIGGVLLLITVTVLALGPVEVFYALHVWVFPEGHQWYFYYQESLMATLMHAPYLFGWIALELLLLTVIVCALLQGLGLKWLERMTRYWA